MQPLSIITSSSEAAVSNSASQHEVGTIVSPLRPTSVGPATVTYGRLHLLGLPGEIRLAIWQAIHYDVLLGSEELWFQRPLTGWDALQLACRQIHIEIADFWPCTILPQAKVGAIFRRVSSLQRLANFRRLSIELHFNKGRSFYKSLALSLCDLAEVLQDLRLFFVGSDKFNVKTFVHGCGLPGPRRSIASKRLTVDGQYQYDLQPVFFVLCFLRHLHTLVIKNANYPLLQSMIIKQKLQLQYLHISTDPRSILHTKHDLQGNQQLIVPPKNNYPPVKVLHISANAAITALQVAAKVSRTLQEINWTLPDVSRQFCYWSWLEQTTMMLNHFGTYAINLRTLRICLHTQLYEAHHSEASLISGLKDHLPRLIALETLELHINSRADFSGAEIICAIPDSLLRLYVSDKLIPPKKLEYLITERFLSCDSHTERSGRVQSRIWETSAMKDGTTRPGTACNTASQNAGTVQQAVHENDRTQQGHRKKRRRKRFYMRTGEIIGEIRTRTDHISYCGGKLGFIGYEYDGHGEWCRCGDCDGTKLMMFRLNGRLLDRERNNHLACSNGGFQISPRFHEVPAVQSRMPNEIITLDVLDDEAASKIQDVWKAVGKAVKEDQKDALWRRKSAGMESARSGDQDVDEEVNNWLGKEKIKSCQDELPLEELTQLEHQETERPMKSFDACKVGKNSRHYGYFGLEEATARAFKNETSVQQEQIPVLTWPDDVLVEENEHWMSGA